MEKINLNQDWKFSLETIPTPLKIAKKAGAIGGLTQRIREDFTERLEIGAGGHHFLNLISQGQPAVGIQHLAGMDLTTKETDFHWQTVNVPHDWLADQPFVNRPELLMSGSKEPGIGYYRKCFSLELAAEKKQQVTLRFEGIMGIANLWLNGIFLGEHFSGYSEWELDVTELIHYAGEGENVLLLQVDTTQGAEGWWYDGAGLYRNVSLLLTPKLTLDYDFAYVYTKELTANGAMARLGSEIKVVNHLEQEQHFSLDIQVADQIQRFTDVKVAPLGECILTPTFTLHDPQLWSPETPSLYQLEVILSQGTTDQKKLVESLTKPFGIRTFAYDEAGFYLNGAPYELKGVCEHQDFAGVGTALTRDIVAFKLEKIKAMGANAYRSAHHFASRDLLELCDEMGVLVMNENRLLESSPWRMNDLKDMVLKSRMNASLAFWSIANEEVIGNTLFAQRMATRLCNLVRSLDYEHLLVSAELLNPDGIIDEEYIKIFDVLGVNYPEAGVMGAGLAKIKAHQPQQPLMCTENASYFSTRGIYRDNAELCQTNNFGSLYSMILPGKRQPGDPGVGGTAHPEEVMDFYASHPFMGGVFLWTAFDYAGEPSPFAWPAISSQFGILDRCGFEKDYFYYYQAKWRKDPVVHLMPHWNQAGLTFDDANQTEIRVFSNCEEVEAFLNGRSLGRQKCGPHSNHWWTAFEAGELLVKGYQNGSEVARDYAVTGGDAVAVTTEVLFSGDQIELIACQTVDAKGQPTPLAAEEITVSVSNGRVLALANGNPADHEQQNSETIRTFSGKALVVVEKHGSQPTKVTATCSRLAVTPA